LAWNNKSRNEAQRNDGQRLNATTTLVPTKTPNGAMRPNKVSRTIVSLTVITLRSIPAFILVIFSFFAEIGHFRLGKNAKKCHTTPKRAVNGGGITSRYRPPGNRHKAQFFKKYFQKKISSR